MKMFKPITKGPHQWVIAIRVRHKENGRNAGSLTSHLNRGASETNEGVLENAQSNEGLQESQKIRRLQVMMNMVMSVISQDPNLTVEEASELVAGTKRAALAMFPDKELAYDIIYKPRLQRLMRERFHLQ